MKTTIILLLMSAGFFTCSEKKETIDFTTLKQTEFNATSFALPGGKAIDSIKLAHDNCMGFSFDANAILARTKDTLFIGSIINRQSLKVVNTINDLGFTRAQLSAKFNVITNPCYEKAVLNFPIKSILGDNFMLTLSDADKAVNKEINDAISASDNAEIQTGSWVYLDMKDALQNIPDTVNSAAGRQYKKNLLDTSNMVLTALESITDVSFIITTGKDMSQPLQALLKSKPSVSLPNSRFSIRLSHISNNKFEMALNGFFPMVGQFMKAELK